MSTIIFHNKFRAWSLAWLAVLCLTTASQHYPVLRSFCLKAAKRSQWHFRQVVATIDVSFVFDQICSHYRGGKG